jgi:hypothetical protein
MNEWAVITHILVYNVCPVNNDIFIWYVKCGTDYLYMFFMGDDIKHWPRWNIQ